MGRAAESASVTYGSLSRKSRQLPGALLFPLLYGQLASGIVQRWIKAVNASSTGPEAVGIGTRSDGFIVNTVVFDRFHRFLHLLCFDRDASVRASCSMSAEESLCVQPSSFCPHGFVLVGFPVGFEALPSLYHGFYREPSLIESFSFIFNICCYWIPEDLRDASEQHRNPSGFVLPSGKNRLLWKRPCFWGVLKELPGQEQVFFRIPLQGRNRMKNRRKPGETCHPGDNPEPGLGVITSPVEISTDSGVRTVSYAASSSTRYPP